MSPILVRPVREQLEHDRIVRMLQTKYRRKHEAGINPGTEQNAPVTSGGTTVYPDLVLLSPERGRRLQAVVEVETGESVNHLEALAQWAHFGRLRAAFHLYVPSGMVDVARRLCEDNRIHVNEIWTYHMVGDEVRFNLVHRSRETTPAATRAASNGHRKAASAKGSARKAKPASRPRPAKTRKAPAAKRAAKASRPARGRAQKRK